jgi:hypothetical protein
MWFASVFFLEILAIPSLSWLCTIQYFPSGVRGLVGGTVAPVIRVTAVVLESKHTNMIRMNSVVEGVWEARQPVTSDISLNDAPSLGIVQNDTDGDVCCVEKL